MNIKDVYIVVTGVPGFPPCARSGYSTHRTRGEPENTFQLQIFANQIDRNTGTIHRFTLRGKKADRPPISAHLERSCCIHHHDTGFHGYMPYSVSHLHPELSSAFLHLSRFYGTKELLSSVDTCLHLCWLPKCVCPGIHVEVGRQIQQLVLLFYLVSERLSLFSFRLEPEIPGFSHL